MDISVLYVVDSRTGIQRVVRNILRESIEQFGDKIVPVTWQRGKFITVEDHEVSRIISSDQKGPILKLKTSSAYRKYKKILYLLTPPAVHFRIKITYEAFIGEVKGLFELAKRAKRKLFKAAEIRNRPINPSDNDILLLLDSSWHYPIWREVMTLRRKNGVKIGFVLYDTIPLEYPQYCDPGLVACFKHWHEHAIRNCDFYLAISEFSKDSLRQQVLKDDKEFSMPADSFFLGADLDSSAAPSTDKEKKRIFNNAYIMVGTIEPRKNHIYVLDNFKKLWKEGSNEKLVFIGKRGWIKDTDFNYILDAVEEFDNFYMFNDLDDAGLELAYTQCKAVIIASEVEGFGLPIVEALSKSKPVLASDIEVFREVGKDRIVYFQLTNNSGLYERIKRNEPFETSDNFRWVNWRESAQEIQSKIKEMVNQK